MCDCVSLSLSLSLRVCVCVCVCQESTSLGVPLKPKRADAENTAQLADEAPNPAPTATPASTQASTQAPTTTLAPSPAPTTALAPNPARTTTQAPTPELPLSPTTAPAPVNIVLFLIYNYKTYCYCLIWVLISLWFIYKGMLPACLPTSWLYKYPGYLPRPGYLPLYCISEAEMYSKVFCTIHDENELECRVNMQNTAPVSMEEFGTDGTDFCGMPHRHYLYRSNAITPSD